MGQRYINFAFEYGLIGIYSGHKRIYFMVYWKFKCLLWMVKYGLVLSLVNMIRADVLEYSHCNKFFFY